MNLGGIILDLYHLCFSNKYQNSNPTVVFKKYFNMVPNLSFYSTVLISGYTRMIIK